MIQNLIYIHAALGGVALLAGAVAISTKKGSRRHKKAGRIFFFSMLFSVILSLIISALPAHENSFLFAVGVFSLYLVFGGYRALRFRKSDVNTNIDKIASWLMILIGLLMIFYPPLRFGSIHLVLLVFGIVGISFGIRDLLLFRKKQVLKENWLRLHLGKMTGGYIAATTAFFVVNEILPNIWNWFVPGILGSIYISYWTGKVKKKPSKM